MSELRRIAGFVRTALAIAFASMGRQPLRAALTAFGILVGVAAVTIVVSLGDAARSAVNAQIDSLGSNALLVRPRPATQSGVRSEDEVAALTEGDAEAIGGEPSIAAVAPLLNSSGRVIWGQANVATSFSGTTRPFLEIRDWEIANGALWSGRAETLGEKVCLIGATVQSELFGSVDPVGRTVRIGRHPFRVLGVLGAKGQDPFGRDQDDTVLMPIKTLRSKLLPTSPGQVHSIVLSATSPDATDQAEREVDALLRQRHDVVEGMERDFSIRSQEEFRAMQEGIVQALSTLLLAIAAVSLVVGGVGVMNIMLVSVTERTREIGIRMAIGARAADILAQFILESILLSLIGGAAGAALAAVAIELLRDALELPMQLPGQALAIAFGISSAIGLVFGLLPARRAARLTPIAALGRE